MNYIDIIILLLLFFSAINGLRNGFVAEAVSFAALIVGILGAIKFSGITSEFLIENLSMKSEHLGIISFIATFLIIVILVYIIGSFIKKLVGIVLPGIIDHLAGLIFGIIKSALILSVILIVFDKIDNSVHILSEDTKTKSRLYEPVRSFAPSIFPFLDVWDDRKNSPGSGNKTV
ncbi:MAG: CvpA family protein [Bacteroidales bacterium]|jgi:membrane protein required for colicin V production|nr:CvpA family protein [Bacteroidales bacterium]